MAASIPSSSGLSYRQKATDSKFPAGWVMGCADYIARPDIEDSPWREGDDLREKIINHYLMMYVSVIGSIRANSEPVSRPENLGSDRVRSTHVSFYHKTAGIYPKDSDKISYHVIK
jgi:hypothetical protein